MPPNAHVSGEVRFHGRELVDADRKGRVRYVPQGTGHIDPTMKIGDFIALSGSDPIAQLARFGLGPEIATRFPHELSGGMLRRVSLAASASDDMELLIADEPTPGLHPEAVTEVTDYFRQVRTDGASILFITHDMITAAFVADRITVMRDGTIDTVAAGVDELHRVCAPAVACPARPRFLGGAVMSLTGENLSASSYGATPLIRDYSITLAEDRILGLHGYSGTGKSTLARLLTGYLTPTGGRVLVDGAPVAHGTSTRRS
ncbi:ATP-binding cassette domain-containing protein [Corynebacterium suedekumii]|nr:ATP-binding cassette domain-containing protein [Corynebacterium suedekumii]